MLELTIKSHQITWLAALRQWSAQRAAAKRGTELQSRLPMGHPDATGHTVMMLSQMKPGDQGHVLELRADSGVRQHLLELGFTVGAPIEFIRVAPLMDPMTVCIRGYQLSLRRREADAIMVRRCPNDSDSPLQGN